jgi:redox-sensitive bicupin YhaK (pirin superfamily)
MKLAIVAGEASGDLHASEVVRELKQLDPNVEMFGIGGDRLARENDAIIFDRNGKEVAIATENGAALLLIGGVPLHEPVARYGPFVMNTTGEIRQAMLDYQSGRFGEIR